tara:strand:- start:825 stop:1514 length:690 start_codon:yes stop_codon:yes gene_type:complete
MNRFKKDLNKILDWDVFTWSKGLYFWDRRISKNKFKNILEIGCGKGGICFYLVKYTNIKKVCASDINSDFKHFHNFKKFKNKIFYKKIDALKIDFSDQTFDAVCFKSVLGGILEYDKTYKLDIVFKEINRVLKDEGELLFMENLRGSIFHSLLRKIFRPWGKRWNYLSFYKLNSTLNNYFESYEIRTFGFFSVFISDKFIIKKIFNLLDNLLIFKNLNYMCYGYGKKKS